MRWLQVKLALIIVVPTFHLFMAGRSLAAGCDHAGGFPAATLLQTLFRGTVATLAFAVAVILGRLKPRLGQAYGRTFGQKQSLGNKQAPSGSIGPHISNAIRASKPRRHGATAPAKELF